MQQAEWGGGKGSQVWARSPGREEARPLRPAPPASSAGPGRTAALWAGDTGIHQVRRSGGRGHARLEGAVRSLLGLLRVGPAAAASITAGALVVEQHCTVDGLVQRAEASLDLHIDASQAEPAPEF